MKYKMATKMENPLIMIDFGGVYFMKGADYAAQKWSKKLKMKKDELLYIFIRSGYWNKWATGKIGAKRYWSLISRDLHLDRNQLTQLKKDFHTVAVARGMKSLVRKIRKKCKIVVLSGNTKERINIIGRKFNLDKEFDEQHYSFHYGYEKPDVRLFAKAIAKMKVRPQDCIVIDDYRDFIDAVKKKGARTILFKNSAQLEGDLRKMGVRI